MAFSSHNTTVGGVVALLLCLASAPLALGQTVLEDREQDRPGAQNREAQAPDTQEPGPSSGAGEIQVRVTLDSPLEEAVETDLLSVSRLHREQAEPLASAFVLRQRIANDEEALAGALRSLGYYDNRVSFQQGEPSAPGEAIPITIQIEPGPRYMVADTSTLSIVPPVGDFTPPEEIRTLLGGVRPADATTIEAALTALVSAARAAGYRFAEISDDRYFLNRTTKTVRIAITLSLGPKVRLGGIQVEGLTRTQLPTLERQITWTEGDVYTPEALASFRRRLVELNLFASVETSLDLPAGEPEQTDIQLPVKVVVSEAPPRTIGGEIAYDTDRGLFLGASWTHRNLRGRADKLFLEAETTGLVGGSDALGEGIDARLAATYTLQDFRRQDQDLDFALTGTLEQTDAFDTRAIETGASLRRRLDDQTNLSLGLNLEHSWITESTSNGQEQTDFFSLVSLPATLRRDTTGNLLNPTSGYRARATLEPTFGSGSRTLAFISSVLEASTYYDVLGDERLVLAGRANVGFIVGSTLNVDDLPANRRFYAGGGGSVRGFSYQGIGPEDSASNPQGGLSRLELNAEARIKVTEEIGIVPFVDAGYVSENPYPTLGDCEFAIGAGLGLRYYSAFGPIRLDVATPVTERDDDPLIQVYVSIGQAF